MKTTFIRIEDESELPVGVVRNVTRPNLFGCLFTNTKTLEVEKDEGILEKDEDVSIFKKNLDDGFAELMHMKELEYNIPLGKHIFKRKADVVVYFMNSNSEREAY